jgi:radical SAM protein (TIGR01212 family)
MNIMTDKKPYNTLNNYYRSRFGKKVFKISLDGGFTCPNKDGSKGYGGCIFCSESGSGDFAGNKHDSLEVQFQKIKDMMHEKWSDGYYISYFQANTNTYKPVEELRELYYKAILLDPKIIGLSIGTRPDAFTEEIYDLLEELNHKTYLQVELGLQTINHETSVLINRGHDIKCFTDCVNELKKRNIEVVVHIINGLPNDTKEDMLHVIDYINDLKVDGIKIHLLHVMKNTKLGKMYLEHPFKVLSMEEYVDITVNQIKRLSPSIIIHRLTGDAPKELLIAPLWSLKKFVVMNEIDKLLRSTNSYQGIEYKEK